MPESQLTPDLPAGTGQKIPWRCAVCGFIFTGEKPPKGCPVCHSPSSEFIPDTAGEHLTYDGEPFDVLLINGSTHRAGNTGYMADLAEEELRGLGVTYRRYNLSEFRIDPCWCCYAVRAQSCTYPCRNAKDDMPAFHRMLAASKAVIVASPINWNGMSVRLKSFLDRTTCMENLYHLNKPGLTGGKVAGILINGHEDGAIKTAMDIWLNFQQMGYILAPFGIGFRTHGSEYNSSTDREFFRNDRLIVRQAKGVTGNVIALMKEGLEERLKGRLVPVTE
ncbi:MULTISPECIES: NAD(P)H-dependent oxidoreductase [unclassified Methanoregula]|uniref:NAD(P)H-dependent oxidoreductase n=1 Tax=unclassified Methanoregula TaxID=2649730 RepID=UPI0009D31DFF|nr:MULTISPECIES: NAD(P)H-dependent oxidoreductase [unclassified Methanoregula]OPX64885.1 MAG: Iron-sulfur flavoprotein [Methanoregula sp. PtaB.Bin085]OPY32937.1 MAG: Iron-sulfur flavoprotein [Methanoregula sp. PtaU1.Bin006]